MKRWLLALVLVALVASAARGQATAKDEEPPEIALFADFGFAGKTPSGRHAPVRVWVQAGESHISGRVELEFFSGFGMTGRIVAPVEVAAGMSSSIALVVPMPEWCERVTLTLRSAQGGRLAETVYEATPGSTTLALPALMASSEELLISMTPRVSAAKIAERFVAESLDPLVRTPILGKDIGSGLAVDPLGTSMARLDVMSRTVGVTALIDQLPLSEAAYEGVLAVIADASTVRQADPRAVFALQRWVLGGGRLVVLADQAGAEWQRLLPPGVPVEAIRIAAPSEMGTPGSMGTVVGGKMSARVNARPMSLELFGEELGWRERWGGEEGSLIVEGPVGFGWVTILSVHPDDVGAAERSWKLWSEALTPAMEALALPAGEVRTLHSSPNWQYQMSLGRSLPGVVFDSIGSATEIGSTAIALVALVTVSLGIALGPVDFFLLRAFRVRHLAWLSALVWIALASGVAVVAPGMLRAGPSKASRLVVVDAMVINEAVPDHAGNGAIAALPAELRAQKLGMTHLFAGSSDAFEIEAGGAWFEYSASVQGTVVSRPMTVFQSPRSGGVEAVRSAAPVVLTPGIWSVRTYMDQGPVAGELSVSLKAGERGWELDVTGIGEGARIISGQLRVGESYYRLGERYRVRQGGSSARLVFESDYLSRFASAEWDDPRESDVNRPYTQRWMETRGLEILMPSALLALPGPAERAASIERLLDTGRYAEVSLFVTDQAMDIGIDSGELEAQRSSVYRLVVPIEGGSGRD